MELISEKDRDILRELAYRYSEIACRPEMSVKRNMWYDMNERHMQRPMVLMDQLPWSEIYSAGEDDILNGRVSHPYWRGVEANIRQLLYRYRHFPVDRVFENYIIIPRPIPYCVWNGQGWGGISVVKQGEIRQSDIGREISSAAYVNQIKCIDDIEKIRDPEISIDLEFEKEIKEQAHYIFDGIIDFKMCGIMMHLGVWDSISMWMGVENCYVAFYEEPELLHALMDRLTRGYINTIHRLNAIEGIDIVSNFCHCSQTYMRDLPKEGDLGLTGNSWACGLAQLFTSVSPALMDEFEVAYMKRIFPYFGAIYYGCCDRLDDRMDIVRKLPKIRKLSCSPWSNREHFAEVMPDYCVMSVKPNPAYLGGSVMDEDVIRRDIRRSIDAAKAYNRSIEFIQKDVSTVRGDPTRLERWAKIAMEEVCR